MARVPNDIEILQKITTALVGCTSVTERRLTDDRRTDDSIPNVNGIREFTFVKMDADHFFRIGTWRLVWSTKTSTEIEGSEVSITSKTELRQCEDC